MKTMEQIYREHADTVYRYILSLTHNTSVAEELTQETFYQAVRSIDHFDNSCKVSTWLCGIARNVISVYRRKNPVMEDAAKCIISDQNLSPEDAVLSQDNEAAILKKMQILKEEVREVMYLRILGELSFKQIGEIMNRSENWARVSYYRGRERLKKELKEDE